MLKRLSLLDNRKWAGFCRTFWVCEPHGPQVETYNQTGRICGDGRETSDREKRLISFFKLIRKWFTFLLRKECVDGSSRL